MNEVRCGNCEFWLGESAVELVFVDHVQKWESDAPSPIHVQPPRDYRLCKKCERVNVFVPKSSLTGSAA